MIFVRGTVDVLRSYAVDVGSQNKSGYWVKCDVRADTELAQIEWEPRASVPSEPNEEVGISVGT